MNATPNLRRVHADRLERADRAWVANWRNFTAVHFSLPKTALAACVPYELEELDGRVWVSLIWFTLHRMRFAGTGSCGRLLCRPISDHPFLNVRTYVRGANGPGICFLAEWIPNRINCVLGPLLYGLPYRFGHFTCRTSDVDGTASLMIDDPNFTAGFAMNLPTHRPDARPCATGSIDEFLLERYQAYTFDTGATRWSRLRRSPSEPPEPPRTGGRFFVAHRRWIPARADWVRCDLGFLRDAFPWFAGATLEFAHLCGDLDDVEMGFPHATPLGITPAIGNRFPENGLNPVPALTSGATRP